MTIDADELRDSARAAGERGEEYGEWLWKSDAVGEAVCALREAGDDSVEGAHREGVRLKKVADGWVSIWTTAPREYDCFGTEEVERCGDWRGRALRRVIAHPRHAEYQEGRYASGLHFSGREGPRAADARREAILKREALERAAASEQELALLRELNDASRGEPLALADLYRERFAEVSAVEKRGFWFSLSATQGNLTNAGAAALRAVPGAT